MGGGRGAGVGRGREGIGGGWPELHSMLLPWLVYGRCAGASRATAKGGLQV